MSSKTNSLEKAMKQIKIDLRKGKTDSFLNLLEIIHTPEELNIIREQKLLLQVQKPEIQQLIAKAYQHSAKKILGSSSCLKEYVLYAELTIIFIKNYRKLSYQIRRLRNSINLLSRLLLIEIVERELEGQISQYMNHHENLMKKSLHKKNELSASHAADLTGSLVRQGAEATNNLARNASRLLNIFSQFADGKPKYLKQKNKLSIQRRINNFSYIAQELNIFEWLMDKLTYGEWVVKEIKKSGSSTNIIFDFKDKDFHHAKVVALRRHTLKLSSNALLSISPPNESKELRRWFKGKAFYFFDQGVDYFTRQEFISSPKDNISNVSTKYKKIIREFLRVLGPDDELLLAAASQEKSERQKIILSHYFIMLALHCLTLSARFYEEVYSDKIEDFYLEIPISLIESLIMEELGDFDAIREVIDTYIVSLPCSSYESIFQKPFIKIDSNHFIGLKTLSTINWTKPIHAEIMKGGSLGSFYGNLVEECVERVLTENKWFVKRGVKIRHDGKVITDADIIAIKDDLLLAIQVKAIAGIGDNVYEHWKARKILEKGAIQARIVDRELKSNETFRKSVVPKSQRGASLIIHSIVVSNHPLFTGYKFQDTPIISIGYLLSLLRGANVEYIKPGNFVDSVQSFSRNDSCLTSDELIHLLYEEPLDWKISGETEKTIHQEVSINHLKFYIPELERASKRY